MNIGLKDASEKLAQSRGLYVELFKHGTLSVELYRPEKIDLQEPHTRDEFYVIATGAGEFNLEGRRIQFKPGDFLFVEAGKEHRFENFSDDFSTWVFFFGPEGGEVPKT